MSTVAEAYLHCILPAKVPAPDHPTLDADGLSDDAIAALLREAFTVGRAPPAFVSVKPDADHAARLFRCAIASNSRGPLFLRGNVINETLGVLNLRGPAPMSPIDANARLGFRASVLRAVSPGLKR